MILIRPNFRYLKCDGRGVRAFELDSALVGDPSSEVLKHGGLHLVITEVVPVGGGADQKKRVLVQYLSEGLRKVWNLMLLVCLYCFLL